MVARRAHNPKVVGSNPAPATTFLNPIYGVFYYLRKSFKFRAAVLAPSQLLRLGVIFNLGYSANPGY